MKKEEKSRRFNPLTVLGTVLCILLIPVLIINCTLIIKSYTHKDEVPNFAGFLPMIVLTDSMYPVIESGDLIICRQADADKVEVGDIITFFDPVSKGSSVVTHRVAEITTDENGGLAFVTRGDANNTEDRAKVPAEKLVGVYKTRIAGAGNVAMFMQTTKGMILCVVCPLLLFVGIDAVRINAEQKKARAELEALRAEKTNA